jgi:uncharacterized protein YbjT (DUF2867 family)
MRRCGSYDVSGCARRGSVNGMRVERRRHVFIDVAGTTVSSVVFITGATGFIGRHVAAAIARAGHTLVLGVHRRAPTVPGRVVQVDFTRDFDVATWRARLAGVDVVVNAVGILRERGAATFAALHRDVPRALFSACVEAGVRRVIQVSALGADADAQSDYHLSKRAADEHLASLPIASTIAQPSLVYGPGGESARWFELLATLPGIPLPAGGRQCIQPVLIDDVVDALVLLIDRPTPRGARIPLVGPRAMTLAEFLLTLRQSLGLSRGPVLPVPMPVARFVAALSARLPHALLDRQTLGMLERGNVASPGPITELLGRTPRAADAFVDDGSRVAARTRALLGWQLPLLRATIGIVWIWTGIVSLGLYPVAESYALLERLSIRGMAASVLLYGAALIDLALGIATFLARGRRWVWRAQIAIVVGYTALISIWLPEFWLHPYGPIVKNLPLVAATYLLATLEDRRWTT